MSARRLAQRSLQVLDALGRAAEGDMKNAKKTSGKTSSKAPKSAKEGNVARRQRGRRGPARKRDHEALAGALVEAQTRQKLGEQQEARRWHQQALCKEKKESKEVWKGFWVAG